MTDEQLAEIRARADAASTGPWTYKADDFSGENWWIASIGADADDGRNYYVTTDNVYASEFESSARGDADFIANARADIPALLAEITQLRAMLRQLEWRHEYAEEMWPDGLKECVVCHNRKMNGHAIGCALAALLSEEES